VGKLLNAGQTCIAPDYALVPKSRLDAFAAAMAAAVARLYPTAVGNADYSSIIDTRHYVRLIGLLEDARARGARAIALAEQPAGDTEFPRRLPPTLVLDVTNDIHCLRDPTRGGVATVLNEIAAHSNVGISLRETEIPVRDSVRGACEILGLDPLYVANEGKLVAIVPAQHADAVVARMRQNLLGSEARIIGEVTSEPAGMVLMKTEIGGTRVIDTLFGEQLPRIC